MILQAFAKEYRISVPISAMILEEDYTVSKMAVQRFYDGKFEVKDLARAEQMAGLVTVIRKHSPDYAWSSRDCIRAMARIQELGYGKALSDQLVRYPTMVTRQINLREYLKQFEYILKLGGNNKDAAFA